MALQQLLTSPTDEICGVGPNIRSKLKQQSARVSLLARAYSEKILALFLSMDPRHAQMLQELIVSMKRNLDEVRDAIEDLEPKF